MAGPKRKSAVQGNRSRSFGGCATCRSRHMKCDEARPTCTSCRDAGFSCGGYEKAVIFDPSDTASSGTARFRRPLFTESERACMSETLTAAIPPRLALWHIEQIDEKSETASRTEDFQVHHGCFGAFRLAQKAVASKEDIQTPELEGDFVTQDHTFSNYGDSPPEPDEMALTPRTRQLFHSVLEDPTPFFDTIPVAMDLWDFANDSHRIEEIFDVDIPISTVPQPQQYSLPPEEYYAQHSLIQTTTNQLSQSESPESVSVNPSLDTSLPSDAVYLVKHYSTTVLKLLTPFRHSKTPWHVLFIPHAKNCLAALTLGENLDHASLCAFYGMLSVSAFSLNGLYGSSTWLETGKTYKQRAREHARHMLHTAYDVPKTAKYKSVLMALLTMVQVAMISGDAEQTDCYFLEAEKFIRVKGLNRKKSRKVRLLHHCYAFDRMFHESVFVAGINSNHRRHVRKAIESSGAVAHSLDGLTFRMGNWSNLEEEMMNIKGKEEGENDLHIQLPGIWSATLYPEIFGVPEVYVFLLSLTIRLGEEKNAAEKQDQADALSLKEFLSRAKAVERCINQLRNPNRLHLNFVIEQPPSSLDTMLDAMHNALAIYFYRRVYDVESSMLQSNVQAVCNCLLHFESEGSDMAFGAARLIWPAFIAGCEAEDPNVRNTILNWLNKYAACSGSRLFQNTRANMERIWEQKGGANGRSMSWVELMKSNAQYATIP